MAVPTIFVKKFTFKSYLEKVYGNYSIDDRPSPDPTIETYADGVLIKKQTYSGATFTEQRALESATFDAEKFGIIDLDQNKYWKLEEPSSESSTSSEPELPPTPFSPPPPPPPSFDNRPIATGSYFKIKNINWKLVVYRNASNKLVFVVNEKGEKYTPPFSFPLDKSDKEILNETLNKINSQYTNNLKKEPEPPSVTVFISGLDKTYNSGYKSLDEQLLIFKYGYGEDKNVKLFRWSVTQNDSEANILFKFLEQNPNVPIFTFSKGCEIVGVLSSKSYVDVKKMYVIEPYGASDKTINKINTAIKNGMPENNIFYGSSKGTGKGIWGKSVPSGPNIKEITVNGKTYSLNNHWSALVNVPKLFR